MANFTSLDTFLPFTPPISFYAWQPILPPFHHFTPSEQNTTSLLHHFTILAVHFLHHFTHSEQITPHTLIILPTLAAHFTCIVTFLTLTPHIILPTWQSILSLLHHLRRSEQFIISLFQLFTPMAANSYTGLPHLNKLKFNRTSFYPSGSPVFLPQHFFTSQTSYIILPPWQPNLHPLRYFSFSERTNAQTKIFLPVWQPNFLPLRNFTPSEQISPSLSDNFTTLGSPFYFPWHHFTSYSSYIIFHSLAAQFMHFAPICNLTNYHLIFTHF